jgi:outer membrane protein assembly factor BamB
MRAVSTHRSRDRAPYRLYVSESGREQRRRRQRRQRRLILVAFLLVIAAGVLVAGGWAQDLYGRLAGSSPAGQTAGGGQSAGGATSPAASEVLIRAVDTVIPVEPPAPIVSRGDGVKVSTFLGDETRRVYGLGPAPKQLSLIWKTTVPGGLTSPVGKEKNAPWYGSGWTGQPAIVRDKGKLYLLWGAYDRKLHKIDLKTGKIVWAYPFDDIIKSSPTAIEDPKPKDPADKYIVMAGSRRGWPSSYTDPNLAPYRAVSFGSGQELWRLPVPLTPTYSRDVDGSGFFYKGRMYSGVESGWFYKLDPFKTESWNGHEKPKIIASRLLLGTSADQAAHQGNMVLESSPSLLNDVVYISSGAGEVYGMRRSDLKVVWDYHIGSDLDGTAVPTLNEKLLVPVEKQYISGHGGVLCLDPSKSPDRSVVWWFPTGDRKLSDWDGGVIGSCAVNDAYDPWGRHPRIAAFNAIDGNLYVISQTKTSGSAPGPNGDGPYPTPKVIAKFYTGGSISTPIMVDDSIVTAGYDNHIHLYKITYKPAEKSDDGALRSPSGDYFTVGVNEKASFSAGGAFESTPVMWKGRIFIGCRDGSLYCVGDK